MFLLRKPDNSLMELPTKRIKDNTISSIPPATLHLCKLYECIRTYSFKAKTIAVKDEPITEKEN